MVKQMLSPVTCTHCGAVYDLCSVTPICRHADCTTFKTPCCGRFADDRKWKSLPDIRPVQEVYRVLVDDAIGFRTVDIQGRMVNVRVIDPDPDGSKFAALTSEG